MCAFIDMIIENNQWWGDVKQPDTIKTLITVKTLEKSKNSEVFYSS